MRAMEWERPFSHPLPGLAVGHTSFAIFSFVRQQAQSVLFFCVMERHRLGWLVGLLLNLNADRFGDPFLLVDRHAALVRTH